MRYGCELKHWPAADFRNTPASIPRAVVLLWSVCGEVRAEGCTDTVLPLPVLGLHWHECIGGPCLHSCGGRRLHCTSSGAWEGIYCLGKGTGWLEGVSTVHTHSSAETAAGAQPYPPIEHVEVEPREHAFARPSS